MLPLFSKVLFAVRELTNSLSSVPVFRFYCYLRLRSPISLNSLFGKPAECGDSSMWLWGDLRLRDQAARGILSDPWIGISLYTYRATSKFMVYVNGEYFMQVLQDIIHLTTLRKFPKSVPTSGQVYILSCVQQPPECVHLLRWHLE